MKILFSLFLTFCLLTSSSMQTYAYKNTIPSESVTPYVIEQIHSDNQITYIFSNSNTLTESEDGTFTLNDYAGELHNPLELQQNTQAIGWFAIGKGILKAIGACSAVQYVVDHDVCRIILNYLGSTKPQLNVYYHVQGKYISGYIPGCQPQHSGPCNSGYYQYTVSI